MGDIIKKKCLFKPVPAPPFILSPEGFFPMFYYSQKGFDWLHQINSIFSMPGRPTLHASGEGLTYSKGLKGELLTS